MATVLYGYLVEGYRLWAEAGPATAGARQPRGSGPSIMPITADRSGKHTRRKSM